MCSKNELSTLAYPAVKGTLWTRIGIELVHYGPILGIEQFLIKRTLSRCFPRTHASTPVRKHTPVEVSCDNVCLIRNCSVSRLVHNVLFSKRIIINEFSLRPMRFHRVPFTAGNFQSYQQVKVWMVCAGFGGQLRGDD